MPATICLPRVTELTQRRDDLAARRKVLVRQLEAASPQLPTPEQLRAVRAQIRRPRPPPLPVLLGACRLRDPTSERQTRPERATGAHPSGGAPVGFS